MKRSLLPPMFAAFALVASTAHADPPPPGAPTPAPAWETRTVQGRRVTVFAREDIHGTVPRPYSFGVTGRGPLGYTALDDTRSVAPEVTAAVRRAPF